MQAFCLCVKELLAEYSVHPAGISIERSGLYANGIPCELQGVLALQDNKCMQCESKSTFSFVLLG